MKVDHRLRHAALLALLAGGLGVAPVAADRAEGEAAIADAAARWNAPAGLMSSIVHCETGGRWDPGVIGRQGERGPAQLLPGAGNGLDQFYRLGYADPHDWGQAMDFLARTIAAGGRSQWHC